METLQTTMNVSTMMMLISSADVEHGKHLYTFSSAT
jgi:hypothetical protein